MGNRIGYMAQINEWLSIDKTSGSGNDSVTLTALQNNGDERTIQLVVKGRFRKQYVDVSQKIDPAVLPKKYFWVKLEKNGNIEGLRTTFEFTYDLTNWNSCPTTLSVPANTYVWFRNTSPILNAENKSMIYFTQRASIGGNLSSMGDMRDYNFQNLFGIFNEKDNNNLIDASELILPWNTLAKGCFLQMFLDCYSLVNPPKLPATTLAESCYSNMFEGCDSLTTAPELPVTTLARECYRWMFYGCESLTTPPKLPATELAEGCYSGMFIECHSLTTAPELPATTLAKSCYSSMFYSCNFTTPPELPATTLAEGCYSSMFTYSDITTPPELPATTLADGCYYSMFYGCRFDTPPELPATILADGCYEEMFFNSYITTTPTLPATTLAKGCYTQMFYGCNSLTTPPELPATTLAEYCYEEMFKECTSLTTTPTLPATELAEWCYYSMFEGCTSLTEAPVLPATTLVHSCYEKMFYGCSNLSFVECHAEDISAMYCLKEWLNGVSSTGTFIKKEGVNYPSGVSGIPSGWTIQTGTENITKNNNYFWVEFEEPYGTIYFHDESSRMDLYHSFDGGVVWQKTPSSTLSMGNRKLVHFKNETLELNTVSDITTIRVSKYASIGGNLGALTNMDDYCCYKLFENNIYLRNANKLRLHNTYSTRISDSCYERMFYGCTSLISTPSLPASKIGMSSYSNMFRGCTSLATAPSLSSTDLMYASYKSMFESCTSLTAAPVLPATELVESCYEKMFYGCSNLSFVECHAEDTDVVNALNRWLNGVSSTGTFIKKQGVTYPTDIFYDGIPKGWTIQEIP